MRMNQLARTVVGAWGLLLLFSAVAAAQAGLVAASVVPPSSGVSSDAAMEPAPPSLATCGIDGREETPAWGRVYVSRNYPKQTFAARFTVAELSKSTDVQLMQQGYVAIGWVEVTRFLHSHPHGKPDESIPGPASAQAVALQEAARIGGEVFTLFGQEQDATAALMVPMSDGWGSVVGTKTGTSLRGQVWRRAPAQSQAQLLVYVAEHGPTSLLKQLLKARVPVDSREPRFCYTPLIAAAVRGQRDAVAALLAAGAGRELVDSRGATALGYAAFPHELGAGACQVARLLRQAGAKEPPQPIGHFSFDFPEPQRCPR